MIVLHAAWASDRLWIWAEAPPASSPKAGRRLGPSPPPYPFDAGPERLLDALARAAGGFGADAGRLRPLAASVPARGRRPIASSQLVAEPPRGRGTLRLRTWTVTGLALDPEEALTLLATARGRSVLARGLPVSGDVAFWCDGLAFTARLVAEGHVLPGLVREEGRFAARWQPALRPEDAAALARLARAMPGAARAVEVPSEPTDGPARDGASASAPSSHAETAPAPADVLQGFVARMADHLVRSAQWPDWILPHPSDVPAPSEAGPRRTGRLRRGARQAEAVASLDERWLAALRAPAPHVQGPEDDLADLARRLAEWRRPLARLLDAPWRLCFRLEEPEPEAEAEAGSGGGAREAERSASGGAREAERSASGGARDVDRTAAGGPDGPTGDGRLDPHGRENGAWRLHYLLQDHRDPSLIVPVERAYAPEPDDEAAFLRRDGDPREHLLLALGQAARLSPVVEASLEEPDPSGAALDAGSAHRFLRDEAPLLQEAGFGLQLPSWWTGDRARLKPSVRATADPGALQAASGLDLSELVEVRWELVLGGEALSEEEIRALARLKAPLVRLRGRWVEVDREGLTRALAELGRAEEQALPASRLLRMAIGAEDGPAGLGVEQVRAGGRLGELLEGLQGEAELRTLPPPDGLRAELRPYQQRGYSWLSFLSRWGLGACLADDMGLGKTIQTLALVEADRGEAEPGRPVLVVCPTSVVTNWKREAARFTPSLRVRVHHGPDRAAGEALERVAEEADLVLTTYALLHRDADDLARVRWRGLVLDEAQNVKNPETARARAARRLEADFRIALTGTPVENHVGDLWSIMEVLNPGLLGSRASFRRRFFLPIQTARDPEASARLRRITGPFILRRLKTDRSIIRDLPERIEARAFCTLTSEQATLYAAVLRELEEGLAGGADGIERKGLVLATLTRLKQVCNHPAHFLADGSPIAGRSGKVERLVELLEEVREAEGRTLLFTQYTRMGELLRAHLQETFGREVPFLHGGVPRKRREQMVDRFQEPGGPDVFLLSLKAGGTGLNLTAANHVVLFDRWWNPAVEAQASDRAFRIGQRRNVQVHKFLCTGTLEEQIDRIIEGKREVARSVVGTGEGWLTELSNEELREVLALRTEGEED